MEFADSVAGLGVGGGSDRAGVQDDYVSRFPRNRDGAAAVEELALNGGAISLSGAAAKLLDIESCH